MTAALMVAKNTVLETVRRKDIYVLAVLSALIIAASCFISFWGSSGLQRFLTDVSMTVIGICSTIIAVVVTARQLPSEIEGRTIFPLLAKPIRRKDYLIGKFMGCWAITVFSLVFFTVSFLIALTVIGGSIGFILLQALYTRALMLGIIVALTLVLSTFLTHSANVTIVLLFYLGEKLAANLIILTIDSAGTLNRLLMQTAYWVIPHIELFDLSKKVVHLWSPVPVWVLLALTIYAALYVTIFLLVANFIFSRKAL